MEDSVTGTDRIRSFLVLAATLGVLIFNWIAATGRLGGIDTGAVSDKYSTLVTPAAYAFSIWGLIYVGMVAFSIYQILPASLVRFRPIRSLYIFSCALNCAWLYFWHADQIVVCFAIIAALCIALLLINYILRDPESLTDRWVVKAPFEVYFGWVTAAMLVNFAIMLKFLNVDLSASAENTLAIVLILLAAGLAVLVRMKLTAYFYPLAIAWALTAIAVKHSGQTAIVLASAIGVVACLIASLSFVMNLRSSSTSSPAA
jgi:hypothetical protein